MIGQDHGISALLVDRACQENDFGTGNRRIKFSGGFDGRNRLLINMVIADWTIATQGYAVPGPDCIQLGTIVTA